LAIEKRCCPEIGTIVKILFAIKSMNSVGGGAERVLSEVVDGLIERGHHVSVLTYDQPNGKSFYPLDSSIDRIDLSIGRVGRRSTFLETAKRLFFLRRNIVENSPDIVVGFMHSMFIPLGIALVGTGIPVIASDHIGVEHYKYHPLEHLLLQSTPYLTKRTVVISEKLRQSFNGRLKKHMTVISNPISIPRGIIKPEVNSSSSRKVVLSVGRLVFQKDHKTLIDAFAMLADEFPEWDLKIFGDGDLRVKLESQIKKLKLQKRIQLFGTIPNVAEEFMRAQIFVAPSLYESFGLATAEALVSGLPVVGFADCPGTNELIKHDQNGILVSGSQRVVALADGMRDLMGSSELRQRFGGAGPDSMVGFSKEKICCKWEELLKKWAEV
jgi:glycosyltransferase involved in cell wall biosynthesis